MLEKLRPLHPLPGVILEWRRITNAMTKVVFPLQREKRHHPGLAMDRIHPVAQTHTATGNRCFSLFIHNASPETHQGVKGVLVPFALKGH